MKLANNEAADLDLHDDDNAWCKPGDAAFDERKLWLGVLERAWLDANGIVEQDKRGSREVIQKQAFQWFASNSRRVGSLQWIIDVTGMNTTAAAIRSQIISIRAHGEPRQDSRRSG